MIFKRFSFLSVSNHIFFTQFHQSHNITFYAILWQRKDFPSLKLLQQTVPRCVFEVIDFCLVWKYVPYIKAQNFQSLEFSMDYYFTRIDVYIGKTKFCWAGILRLHRKWSKLLFSCTRLIGVKEIDDISSVIGMMSIA